MSQTSQRKHNHSLGPPKNIITITIWKFRTSAAPPKASADGDENSHVTYMETAMHP